MSNDLDFMGDDYDPKAAAESQNSGDFAPLPAGWYNATVYSAEVVNTKAAGGKMVKLRLDITGPTHAGRVVFDQIVVKHSSTQAQEIGRAKFGQLCVACGFETAPKETRQLVGRRVAVRLKIESDKQYGDQNRTVAYKAASGGSGAGAGIGLPTDLNDDDIPF